MAQTNRQSYPPEEEALPKGHPCRADYVPGSPEAIQWLKNQRALQQTSGLPPNYNPDLKKPHGGLVWVDGVDPLHPELERYTGRKLPAKVAAKPATVTPPAERRRQNRQRSNAHGPSNGACSWVCDEPRRNIDHRHIVRRRRVS